MLILQYTSPQSLCAFTSWPNQSYQTVVARTVWNKILRRRLCLSIYSHGPHQPIRCPVCSLVYHHRSMKPHNRQPHAVPSRRRIMSPCTHGIDAYGDPYTHTHALIYWRRTTNSAARHHSLKCRISHILFAGIAPCKYSTSQPDFFFR